MSAPVATATLLDALPDKTVLGAPPPGDRDRHDSRRVAPGECFVAVAGFAGRLPFTPTPLPAEPPVVAEGADRSQASPRCACSSAACGPGGWPAPTGDPPAR
jgi:hypothetical protein